MISDLNISQLRNFSKNFSTSMINDLKSSMVFKDHSILQRRDYYLLIMDCNHDIRLLFNLFI